MTPPRALTAAEFDAAGGTVDFNIDTPYLEVK